MSNLFGELEEVRSLLNKEELVEEPVALHTFVTDRYYLGLKPLSPVQTQIVENMTQIYKHHTLVTLYGKEKADAIWDKTVNEVVCQIGKGGGKDYSIRIAFARIVYLLHCLKDPLEYYGIGAGEYIDLLNIAVNAEQAQQVFFEPFKNILARSPWFQEQEFIPMRSKIIFDKRSIRCFSGHSEGESWEGYNFIAIVLDEIAAFKTQIVNANTEAAKHSAKAIYDMSRLSTISRFPDTGKVALLSFPRYEGDFITTRYDAVIEYKETTKTERNLGPTTIHWFEDNIKAYKEPKVWAVKCPTFISNPTKRAEDFTSDFIRDPVESFARILCVDEETEILTRSGWKKYDEVKKGDIALSYNHKTGLSEWQSLNDVYIYPKVNTKMLRMEGKQHSSFTTMDHRWPVIGRNGSRTWNTSKDLKSNQAIPVAAVCSNLPVSSNYSDAFVEMIGWIWTEGASYNEKGYKVVQSHLVHSEYCERIKKCCEVLWGEESKPNYNNHTKQLKWRRTVDYNTGITTFYINQYAAQKIREVLGNKKCVGEGFIASLTEQQLRIFIETSIDGDGSREAGRGKGYRVRWHQTDRARVNIFEMACALLGQRTNTMEFEDQRPRYLGKKRYTVALLKSKNITPVDSYMNTANNGTFIMEAVAFDGLVWCVNIPNNAWLARRKGTVFYTGNCIPPKVSDAYFRDPDAVLRCFHNHHPNACSDRHCKLICTDKTCPHPPWDDEGRLPSEYKDNGDESPQRFIHIDLGWKRDRTAVVMGHCRGWTRDAFSGEKKPIIRMDLIKYWEAPKDGEIEFNDVRRFVFSLADRFNIAKITMDNWNSIDTLNLFLSQNLFTEFVTIKKEHYDTLSTAIYDGRLEAYYHPILVEQELLKLQIERGTKIDHPNCFVGSTRIPTLGGKYPTIEEMVGKETWVYSCTPSGVIVPGLAKAVLSGFADEFIDIVLDNGYVARCTPEHKWMLLDGTYKEAKDLKYMDRLMPVNFGTSDRGGWADYERLTNSFGFRKLTHHMVYEYFNGPIKKGNILHHIDHDKHNNTPDNLIQFSKAEHQRHHSLEKHASDPSWRLKLSAGTVKFNKLESTKEKRREYMLTEEAQNLRANRNNHRIRAVIGVKYDKPVPVYDLQVSDTHNFALPGGVFVHNSGFKDGADSLAGMAHSVTKNSLYDEEMEIEVIGQYIPPEKAEFKSETIEPKEVPFDLAEYLDLFTIL